MAHSLLGAGFPLTVYNRTPHRVDALRGHGAVVADSPAELAASCDVVVTMLSDGVAVRQVLAGPNGVLSGVRPDALLIDMSTTGPVIARELAHLSDEHRAVFLDAPVSGSVSAAEAATLTTVVGGDHEAFLRARPVLAAMTAQQMWLGASGAGAAMKLALNGMVASTAQMLGEALVLAERSGIDRAKAYEAIATSAVGSRFVDYKRQAFLDPQNEPVAFTLALMQKDLALEIELARTLGVPLPGIGTADQTLTVARGICGDDADLAAVADAIRGIATTTEEVVT
jgi:3-hydroxyisobutyrate dehydrogenase-like beta-hydroxyacid dehydrogenase